MAQIIERNSERRLQLDYEEFTRPMNWGPAWSKLRIAMRIGFNGVNSFSTYEGGPGLVMGSQGYLSPVSIAYLGFWLNTGWTYTPAAGPYFGGISGNWFLTSRVGTTVATTNGGASTGNIAWAPSNLSQLIVDITKAGNTFSVLYRSPTTADVIRNVLVYDFLRNVENDTAPYLYCSQVTSSALTRTMNDAYQFDTISVYNNKSIPTLEIGSLEVFRFE